MSIITGLKAMEAAMTTKEYTNDGPKVRWVKLEDRQVVKARPINELDEDSSNYDPSRGLTIVVVEHTNPKDYKKKAVCTMDTEGRCYGCEMNQKDPKAGWYGRKRFYINLLVDDSLEPPYVAVWSQGLGKQSSVPTLVEYYHDTQAISNLSWKLKRQGSGTDTTYVLLPTVPDTEPFDWKGIEPFPLDKVVRQIPYADQESFYLGFDSALSSATSTSVDW
jgi:hypothetical protein